MPYERYDRAPAYYILGRLVFEPLTVNYLKMWGSEWHNRAPSHLLNYYDNGEQTDDRREIVVLVKVLADEINAGYHNRKNRVISHVNGKRISTMKDLVSAFEEHKGKCHVIEDESGYKIVLDRNKVEKNGKRILKKYKINSNRSKDLERW